LTFPIRVNVKSEGQTEQRSAAAASSRSRVIVVGTIRVTLWTDQIGRIVNTKHSFVTDETFVTDNAVLGNGRHGFIRSAPQGQIVGAGRVVVIIIIVIIVVVVAMMIMMIILVVVVVVVAIKMW
jgi:hypothetical protein